MAEFYQTFKELIPILLNFSRKKKEKEHQKSHSMKPVLQSFQNPTRMHQKREI
jgi:hypothetical protein